ncbi:MAG TPA: HAD family hydrolase [Clostridia bacterium]|nr:HAD family hydrolase [Clostridia bacterium]
MRKPEAIVFDFGGTLVIDSAFDFERGANALRSAALNGDEVSTAQLKDLWDKLYEGINIAFNHDAPFGLETPLSSIFRYIFDVSGLKFDKDLLELEYIFDSNNSDRTETKHMKELLKYIEESGIKTAVISNITLSGEALGRAIRDVYPDNSFEFVITSADYCLLKPAPFMFKAAANRLSVSPKDCFYCGDSFGADVEGAKSAGFFPVLYDTKSHEKSVYMDDGAYLKINSWDALTELLSEV